MHAVRGTIGYDPNPPSSAAKRESRDRVFGIERLGDEPLDVPSTDEQAVTFLEAAVTPDPAPRGWVVCWTAPNGRRRHLGRRIHIGDEQACRVIGVLQRQGITVVTLRRKPA